MPNPTNAAGHAHLGIRNGRPLPRNVPVNGSVEISGTEPTKGGRDKGNRPRVQARARVGDSDVEGEEDASETAEGRCDDEGHVLHTAYRTAHLERSLLILAGGPDGVADLAVLEEQRHDNENDGRDSEHDDIRGTEAHAADVQVRGR
jgi:hypothetical protein